MLTVRSLNLVRNKRTILQNLDLEIENGEFVVVIGQSGAGKSQLLRRIAGLDPELGQPLYQSEQIGLAFQQAPLVPWLNLKRNLLVAGITDVNACLADLQLQDFAEYLPSKISPGMRQKLNLARALSRKPKLVLLDEPFASLDQGSRFHLYKWLNQKRAEMGFAVLMVTHDLYEAFFLADRIDFLSKQQMRISESFRKRASAEPSNAGLAWGEEARQRISHLLEAEYESNK